MKRGEHGALYFDKNGAFFAPAYPLEAIKDPTGAGDSFAGAFMGYLARAGATDEPALRRAIVHGSVVASYTCEEFSVGRLTTLDDAAIARRYAEFRRITHFEDERE